jgi:NAD(P)-dependent dehydrogenase (short-subunit alcohol dehydrogenase family)
VKATPGILQDADPARWRQHLFGLPPDRWERLRGKSFWITGAGTGYGRCLAVALAAAGAEVVLTGRRRGKLEDTLREMREFGIVTDGCRLVACDITDGEAVASACAEVRRHCRALYGLIGNAALPSSGRPYPLQQDTLEEGQRLLTVNVTAPWWLARAILPDMLAGNAMRILFMTSEAGWADTPGFGLYNVSKAALNSLSASLAAECAARSPQCDVQINALIPGEARTEMNQGSTQSPYAVVSMALALLSHPAGGPNGKFFHRDGRHFGFAYAAPYGQRLL